MTPAPLHPAASVSASDMANPDGIHEDHVRPQDATRHASVASIIIAIGPTLWRDQTINSVIPAPEKEAKAPRP